MANEIFSYSKACRVFPASTGSQVENICFNNFIQTT